jgi:hypothetical protein
LNAIFGFKPLRYEFVVIQLFPMILIKGFRQQWIIDRGYNDISIISLNRIVRSLPQGGYWFFPLGLRLYGELPKSAMGVEVGGGGA